MSIKTIGIIIRNFSENDKKFVGTRADLFKIIMSYNVNVIGIPICMNFENLKDVIKICDGIILSGGDAFCKNDFKLVKYLYDNDIPTLGICLGMQSMGELFNGYKEIIVEGHNSKKEYVHRIMIDEKSLLYNIIGKRVIIVNSRHNSAIPHTKLDISAVSANGIIEAVEDKNKRFFIGVEWHPESLKDKNTERLFNYFIKNL